MKDKVQKIREEVARLSNFANGYYVDRIASGYKMCCSDIISFIDSLPQEEPVSMWHDVSEEPKSNMELICVGQYGNPLVLSSNSDSFKSRDISKWAYFNDLLNLSNAQRTTKNWKELVSEDLEEASRNYADDEEYGDDVYFSIKASFKAGAKWQKEQMMKDAVNGLVYAQRINGEVMLRSNYVKRKGLNFGDKVKVIVIKEE